jgi:small GTP-binding protein
MGCGDSKKLEENPKLNVRNNKRINEEAKIVLLGDSGVGKSSIAMRYVNNTFSDAFEVTIGGGYLQQLVRLRDGSTIKMDIWDTGGQERFRSLLQMYYRDAQAALITYDVSSERSFEACEYWVNELREREENCMLFLVGNKIDIPVPERKIDPKKVEAFAQKHNMIWVETSAKTGENINKLFEKVAQEIISVKSQSAAPAKIL